MDLAAVGIEIECSSMPGLFKGTSPHAIFVRQIAGAASEFEARTAVEQMRNGRAFAKAKSMARNLTGAKKCEGRKNFLENAPGIIKALANKLKRLFAKLRTKRGGTMTWRTLADYLATQNIVTKTSRKAANGEVLPGGLPINPGRLMQWVQHCDKQ